MENYEDQLKLIENLRKPLSGAEIESAKKNWEGKWIAVVDDDTADDLMLEEQFRHELGLSKENGNFQVQRFPTGEDFLSAGNAGDFDAVIIDGRLGGYGVMEGPEIADEIHATLPSVLLVIGRSAEEQFSAQFSKMPEIVDAVIPKSVDIPETFNQIARLGEKFGI